jgi:serine/threonine protein kinase
MVMEFVSRGSLKDVLAQSPTIAENVKLRFVLDAATGMAHLHRLGRIHRDLKSSMISLLYISHRKIISLLQRISESRYCCFIFNC